MASIEDKIREFEDIENIKKLKFRYARLADEQNLNDMVDLFTDDAVWEGPQFGRYDGKDAIRGALTNFWTSITWSIHLMTNPIIEVDPSGQEATGQWYIWEPATVDGRPLWMVGSYDEKYRKEDGRWKFSYVYLNFEFMTPYESGWVKQRYVEPNV